MMMLSLNRYSALPAKTISIASILNWTEDTMKVQSMRTGENNEIKPSKRDNITHKLIGYEMLRQTEKDSAKSRQTLHFKL